MKGSGHRRGVPRLTVAALIAAGLAALSACGGGGESKALKVTMTEPSGIKNRFEGVKPVSGGRVEVTFTNKGRAPHELQLLRVDGSHSRSEVLNALQRRITGESQPLAAYLHPSGGVSDVKPGQTAKATMVLAPGKYFVVDTGAPAQAEAAPRYFTQGAIEALEVKGGKSSASLPKARQTVTVRDTPGAGYAFAGPPALKAGKTTLALDNQSMKAFHQVTIAPIAAGKTIADVQKALAASRQPPVNFDAGVSTAVIDHNSKLVADLRIPGPGNYVMLCLVSDPDGKGPPHYGKGLLKELKVS